MSETILKISGSKIEFPNIEIMTKEKMGIYSKNPIALFNNLIKIILKPKKYTEEYILEGMDAENLTFFSRRIFHVISKDLWENKSILDLLKRKNDKRKIIIMRILENEINIPEIVEISKYIEKNLIEENILVISDSNELLEAICEKVIDDKGNQIPFDEGTFIKRIDTNENIEKLEEIEDKYVPLIYKKRELNLR
jgi:hypothetical protein